jgi:hypothetical protein
MKCPNCGSQLESEYVPLVKDTVNTYPSWECSHMKSWHFRCEGCDSEWVKVGHEKLRLLDAAV